MGHWPTQSPDDGDWLKGPQEPVEDVAGHLDSLNLEDTALRFVDFHFSLADILVGQIHGLLALAVPGKKLGQFPAVVFLGDLILPCLRGYSLLNNSS